ncbi:MAG TPA: MFS transporter [Bryobacteraceae bacterium]|nr:MFS transporter [Bryobacteraceae bacterium]
MSQNQNNSSRIVFAAILAIFVYGVIAAMLGVLLASFHLTPEQNGHIALAQAIGMIIASLSAGPIIDKKGKKLALVTSLALIAGSLFLLRSSTGYEQQMLWVFVLGLGGGILVTAANALAGDVNEERRSATLNFLNLFFGLGGMATPLIAANVVDNDPQMLCLLAAVLAAITLVIHMTTPMPGPKGGSAAGVPVGELVSKPALWLFACFLFLYVAAEIGVWNWLAQLLQSRGIDSKAAQNIVGSGFAFGILVGRVVVSRILIKIQPSMVLLASAALMLVTTYILLQTSDPSMAWGTVFAAGIAMAPVFPTTLGMVGDAFPRGTATAMGFVITFGWFGLAVSSRVIGALGGNDPAQLGTALMVLPAVSALMVVIMLIIRTITPKKA